MEKQNTRFMAGVLFFSLTFSLNLSGFNAEFDRCALCPFDVYFAKRWNEHDVDAVEQQVATSNGCRLDGLIHSAGADCLHFCPAMLTHNARDCPRNRS